MPVWNKVKTDMLETLRDANKISQKIMWYDGFGAMDTSEPDFASVIKKSGAFELDGVGELAKELAQNSPWNGVGELRAIEVMVADRVSRMCVVIDMLEKVN